MKKPTSPPPKPASAAGYPTFLRDYYSTMGRFEALNSAFNRLLPPEKLYLSDSGMLVFYTENQDVVIWGIDHEDFGKPDPAVYGSYDADREEWLLDADTMEHFYGRWRMCRPEWADWNISRSRKASPKPQCRNWKTNGRK